MIKKNTVSEIFQRKLGVIAAEVTPITTGKFNTSYFVGTNEGDYVLRIAPDSDSVFIFYERNMMAQEPAIHKLLLKKTDVPAAEIYVYDTSRGIIPRDYLIMEKLPGQALSQMRISSGDYNKVMFQVGQHLAQVHELTAESYGYLGEHHCMEPQKSWASAFKIMWSKLVNDICSVGFYDEKEAAMIKGLVDRYDEIFQRSVPSSLLHMDIWSQNILVDQQMHVTGIVDWDRALWGDVEIEYAVLDYCGISEASFWEGYGSRRPQTKEAGLRNIFYLLYEIQKYIVIRAGRQKNPDRARSYKDQTFSIIKKYLMS